MSFRRGSYKGRGFAPLAGIFDTGKGGISMGRISKLVLVAGWARCAGT